MTVIDVNETKTAPCKAPASSYLSPMTKKRRFQRRNSKTAAMLRGDSWNLISMMQQEHQQLHNVALTPQATYEQEERTPPCTPVLPDHRFFTLKLLDESLRQTASSPSGGDDENTRSGRSNSTEPPRVPNCPYNTTDNNPKSKQVLSHEEVASLVASLLRNPR